MKILFVFNHPAPYKINLLNALSKYYDLDVIFERTKNSNRPNDFYYQKNIQFSYNFLKGIAFGEENHFSFRLKNYIKNNYKRYDLIVMNGYSTISEIIAIKYMIKHHISYSLYVNGGIIKKDSKYKKQLKTKLISHAFKYFSPSLKTDEYLIHYGASKEKISHYVYSTVYAKDVLPSPLAESEKNLLRTKCHLSSSNINFVTFGQFIERKGNKELLEIFKKLPDNYHLTLIGEGKEKALYQKYILDNILQNRIELRPFLKQEELLKTLPAYDYFISLSKEDIYGHMINEALSQGLPVICSNKIVSAYKLIDSSNGIIVDDNSEHEIMSAIKEISQKDPLMCLNKAKENTIEEMVKSHLNII